LADQEEGSLYGSVPFLGEAWLGIQAWQQISPIFEMVQADRQQGDMGF